MSDTDRLSTLQVYTNRGTVAYPLATTDTDLAGYDAADGPADDRESAAREPDGRDAADRDGRGAPASGGSTTGPGAGDADYDVGDHVPPRLSERLGTELFVADSRQDLVRSYFRADVGRPVQLTAEVHAETVDDAIDGLPPAVEAYVTAVRDGTLACRSLDGLAPGEDGRAFAAVAEGLASARVPAADAVETALRFGDRVDLVAPSVEAGVGVAAALAADDTFPDLEAVVTKTTRTAALADADVVVAVGDVDEVTLRNRRRHEARAERRRVTAPVGAALRLAGRSVDEGVDGAVGAVARTIEAEAPTDRLRALPTLAYRLNLLTAALVGLVAGAFLPGSVLSNAAPFVSRLPAERLAALPGWARPSVTEAGAAVAAVFALGVVAGLVRQVRLDRATSARRDASPPSEGRVGTADPSPGEWSMASGEPDREREPLVTVGRESRTDRLRWALGRVGRWVDPRLLRLVLALSGALAVVALSLAGRLG